MDGLREAGYMLPLDKKRVVLKNKKKLLERWITGYGEILKPALFKGKYDIWDKKKIEGLNLKDFKELGMVLGGEPAAERLTNYLKPEIITLYANQEEGMVMRKLVLLPNDDGKIELYKKFWNIGDNPRLHTAPELLIYTDLLLTDDPRCIETAKIIYKKYLADEFEEN